MTEAAWNAFWTTLPAEPGTALWDSAPELTAERHIPLFREYFDPRLPLVDLGCGNGRQTQRLARDFARVVGIDIAEAAVKLAAEAFPAANVTYRCADLLDRRTAAALRAELGDANVYVRGVLHQLPPDGRTTMLGAIKVLLGGSGHVFAHELTERTGWYIQELLADGASLPKTAALTAHFGFGVRTAPAQDGQLRRLFEHNGFDVVDDAEIPLYTTEKDTDGQPLRLPTSYVVARAVDNKEDA